MAGSLNKVMIIGHLGRDPELRKTPGGASVTDFSVATTERFTDKSGNRQEQTEWHNIVMWGRQAETAAQYLRKGSSVYIEGKLRTRSWEDNGKKNYRTEIIAQSFQFLDNRSGGQNSSQGGFGGGASNFGESPAGNQDQYGFAPMPDVSAPSFNEPPVQPQQAPIEPQGMPVDDDLPF